MGFGYYAMTPIAASEREPIVDAFRGFAIFGILLVNMEVMRSSEWLLAMGGFSVGAPALPERIVQFAIGWLATGKFLSSLAILFGIGAALMTTRALRAGLSARPLLARRYVWLMTFGIAHMLLFPGDILFLYGLTGFLMLTFVMLPTRALWWCSAALLAIYSAVSFQYWTILYRTGALGVGAEPTADSFMTFVDEIRRDTS